MIIERITDKYQIWKDGSVYVLTVTHRRNRYIVKRGTMQECEDFMSAHPYGLTRIEAERIAI